MEIDDSIIIDKKIIDFLNSYSKKSKKSSTEVVKKATKPATKEQKKVEKNNQAILLITPESLEAMLINTPTKAKLIFKHAISIVIDEFHSFLGNDRGDQLLSLLNRLEKYTKNETRRIGLSATIGDKKYIAKALDSKNYNKTKIISGSVSGNYKLKLLLKGYEYDSKLVKEELEKASDEEMKRIKKKLPDV